MKTKLLFFFPVVLFASCSSDYSPKPKGYFYIELPEPVYRDYADNPFFKCSISSLAFPESMPKNKPSEEKDKTGMEFTLNYPRYNAQIFCSCIKINPAKYPTLSEENRKMTYLREKKAKEITETAFSRPEQKVYGQVYEIEGNPVSPIQFVISDSARYFFRGALYFNTAFNRDSIAPVLTYINKDIHVMIESFQWKQ